jgi:hypothetical protein
MNPAAGPPMLHEPHRPCDGQFAWIPTNVGQPTTQTCHQLQMAGRPTRRITQPRQLLTKAARISVQRPRHSHPRWGGLFMITSPPPSTLPQRKTASIRTAARNMPKIHPTASRLTRRNDHQLGIIRASAYSRLCRIRHKRETRSRGSEGAPAQQCAGATRQRLHTAVGTGRLASHSRSVRGGGRERQRTGAVTRRH